MGDAVKKWEVLIQAALLRTKMAMGGVRNRNTKPKTVAAKDIMKQSKVLTNDYIDDRLIRSGLNTKKWKVTKGTLSSINETVPERSNVSLHTLRNLVDQRNEADSENDLPVEDISKVLICVGEYLELRHNGLYTDVLNQLNVRSIADTNLNKVFTDVAKEMFSAGITWAKVVALFAFAGGMAVDCVLGGSPMHVGRIKSWTNEFIQTDLLEWICEQGGWLTMFDLFMTRDDLEDPESFAYWTIWLGFAVAVLILGTLSIIYYFRQK